MTKISFWRRKFGNIGWWRLFCRRHETITFETREIALTGYSPFLIGLESGPSTILCIIALDPTEKLEYAFIGVVCISFCPSKTLQLVNHNHTTYDFLRLSSTLLLHCIQHNLIDTTDATIVKSEQIECVCANGILYYNKNRIYIC